jgi:1-acyl-sn-glycerol-3-phosphate acyltransferase
MRDGWYTFLSTLCARAYFSRIRVIGAERLPRGGPILYAGLHRNGAVDGFIYKSILRRAIFLIAAQLQKGLFSRVFFTGIPVVRDKDSGDRGMNAEAMERCQELLAGGGELFIFPEGTSSLGPQHLPFKSGAARIAVAAWQAGIPVKIVPLGINYNALATFRSSVEVIVGEPIGGSEIWAKLPVEGQVAETKRMVTEGLEKVGVNVESAEYLAEISMIATIATPAGHFFETLKFCEKGIPEKLRTPWRELHGELQSSELLRSEAAMPFSSVSPWISLVVGILLSSLVAAAALLNCLPLGGAFWAGKKFPDGRNVITLWRILVGVPLFFFWFVAVILGFVLAGRDLWVVFFFLLTGMGWLAYQAARQLLVSGWNGIRFPGLRRKYLEFQRVLFEEMRNHGL